MRKVEILGVKVAIGSYGRFLNIILDAAEKGKYVDVAPVAIHPIASAAFNRHDRRVLNRIDYVLPDSFWLLWAINFLFNLKMKERFYGPDLMRVLCMQAKKQGLNVFLYGGGTKNVLNKLEDWYSSLPGGDGEIYKFKATYSINNKEIRELANKVSRAGKGILFIGLASPLQHEVLIKLKNKLSIPVVAVGAGFDFISGTKSQAPRWVHKVGFEWLYRVLHEPKRLVWRYLFSFLFFPLLIKEKLKSFYSNLLIVKKL